MLKLIIKEVAEKQGLNRSQLQLRSGVTMPLLTRYWTNKTESVTLPALERIAHALGVDAGSLIVQVEEQPST